MHYILGTMHNASRAAYTYADIAKEKIAACHSYIGEMDLNSMDQELLIHAMHMKDSTLEETLGIKKFSKYRKILLRTFQIELANFNNFIPFYIQNMITDSVFDKYGDKALDHHLWHFAERLNKEMGGLESFKDQMEVLENIPLSYQFKTLKSLVKKPEKLKEQIKNLNKAYIGGDIQGLYQMTAKQMGPLRKLMLRKRHEQFYHKIDQMDMRLPTFISLGAAHLGGNYGMIAYLKRKNYQVKCIV